MGEYLDLVRKLNESDEHVSKKFIVNGKVIRSTSDEHEEVLRRMGGEEARGDKTSADKVLGTADTTTPAEENLPPKAWAAQKAKEAKKLGI